MSDKPKKEDSLGPDLLAIIVFVAVAFVLAAVFMPNFKRARSSNELAGCKSNLMNIGTALEMYSTDFEGKYPRHLNPLVPKYLKTLPVCRWSEGRPYTYAEGTQAGYNTAGFRDYYIINCTGPSHEYVNLPPGFPQYDGLRGLYER